MKRHRQLATFSESARKELEEIECHNPQCRTLFIPTRSWQKFCDEKCRNDFHNNINNALRAKKRES